MTHLANAPQPGPDDDPDGYTLEFGTHGLVTVRRAREIRLAVVQALYDMDVLTEAEARALLRGPLDPDDPNSPAPDDSRRLAVKPL